MYRGLIVVSSLSRQALTTMSRCPVCGLGVSNRSHPPNDHDTPLVPFVLLVGLLEMKDSSVT
jgi:hypothetical protein